MTTEIATLDSRSGDGEASIARTAEAIWVAIHDTPWSSLAVVPAEPGLPVDALAAGLARVGSTQRGQAIETRDLRGRAVADSQDVVESLAVSEPRHHTVVAVDCPLESQAGLLFARSAGAAILVLAMEHTRSDDAERVVELVGRSRFLGAVVQAPARG